MIYRITDNIVSRKVAGETLLVPVSGALADLRKVYTLNPVAEHVWNQLDGRRTTDDLLRSVLQTFDVAEEEARQDLNGLLEKLESARLIEKVGN